MLALLRVTKGARSEYDHLMLGLHDRAKADLDYQQNCGQQGGAFRAGNDLAVFFRPGDARRRFGPAHARADDPRAGLRALRPAKLARWRYSSGFAGRALLPAD